MLDKKQIWVIFLFEFKTGCEAAKTTCNISNAFGPGTANEHTVQWWFKRFCKGEQSLEGEEHSDRPLEVDSNQLRGSSKPILLHIKNWDTRICWSTPHQPFYGHSVFEANWKGEKARWVGGLMSWLKIEKKIIVLKYYLLLFYATTMNNFSFRLWRVTIQKVDFLWQLVMTGSDGGPRSSSKALPKATLTPNKRSWSLSGGLLPIWSTTAFWISVKP